jgi:hypothetical protein
MEHANKYYKNTYIYTQRDTYIHTYIHTYIYIDTYIQTFTHAHGCGLGFANV